MTSAVNAAYIFFSLLSVILVLITTPWHWRVRNTGTLLIIFWLSLGNASMGINAALFANTSEDIAPVWCDISATIGYIYAPGFTAGQLCLLRRLESIASTRHVNYSDVRRRRDLIVDLLLGIGLPLLLIPMHFVVQGHRMNIVQEYGCTSPVYYSVASIFLYQIWQIVLSLACAVYAFLTLRWFVIRRKQFTAVLQSSGSGLNKNKYVRLMALAVSELFFAFPICLYVFVSAIIHNPLMPYTSWSDVHEDFNTTLSFQLSDLTYDQRVLVELGRWLAIIAAFTFFGFFGLTKESRASYASWYDSILRTMRLRRGPRPPKAGQITSRRTEPSSALSHMQSLSRDPQTPRSFGGDEEKSWGPTPKDGSSFGMTEYTVSSPGSAVSFGPLDQTRTFGSIHPMQSVAGNDASPNGEVTFEERYGPLSTVHVTTERIVVS